MLLLAVVVTLALKVTSLVLGSMEVITVFEATVELPELLYTGIPTLRLVTLGSVTVFVPVVNVTFAYVGSLTPTINFTNTQAASQLLGALLVRQEFSQLRSNSTRVKLAALLVPALVF